MPIQPLPLPQRSVSAALASSRKEMLHNCAAAVKTRLSSLPTHYGRLVSPPLTNFAAKRRRAAPLLRVSMLLMAPDAAFFFLSRGSNSVSIGAVVFYCRINTAAIISFGMSSAAAAVRPGDAAAPSPSPSLGAERRRGGPLLQGGKYLTVVLQIYNLVPL